MNTNDDDLDIFVLKWVRDNPKVPLVDKFYSEVDSLFPCSYEEFVETIYALKEQQCLNAVFSSNRTLIRVLGIQAEGYKLLRQNDRDKNHKANTMNIGSINAGHVSVANEHIGDNNMQTVVNNAYEDVDRLLNEIAKLPLSQEEKSVMLNIQQDVEEAKQGRSKKLKDNFTAVYLGCISSAIVSHGPALFSGLLGTLSTLTAIL